MNDITTHERILAAAAHAGFLLGGLGFLVLPFLIKTIWRSDDFISGHAKQALYMQVGAFVVTILAIVLAFIIPPTIATGIAIALLTAAWVLFAIVGAIKAISGEEYVYPALKMIHIG